MKKADFKKTKHYFTIHSSCQNHPHRTICVYQPLEPTNIMYILVRYVVTPGRCSKEATYMFVRHTYLSREDNPVMSSPFGYCGFVPFEEDRVQVTGPC